MGEDADGGDSKFPVPRRLRKELSELAEEEWVKREAKRKTGREFDRKYSRVLAAILPEEVSENTILSEDMVTIEPIDEDIAAKVRELSGESVSAQDVIEYYMKEAEKMRKEEQSRNDDGNRN
jgi:hypothetical protein